MTDLRVDRATVRVGEHQRCLHVAVYGLGRDVDPPYVQARFRGVGRTAKQSESRAETRSQISTVKTITHQKSRMSSKTVGSRSSRQ